jgi:hypothetical protein
MILFFLLLFVIWAVTAVVEYRVLDQYFGERSLAACVLSAALPCGSGWGLLTSVAAWLWPKPELRALLTSSGFFHTWLLHAGLLCLFATIPAGLTAVLYQKSESSLE